VCPYLRQFLASSEDPCNDDNAVVEAKTKIDNSNTSMLRCFALAGWSGFCDTDQNRPVAACSLATPGTDESDRAGVQAIAAKYRKSEAREWSREDWHGLCNDSISSYRSDLKRFNESSSRHDVRRKMGLGFQSAVRVSEAVTNDAEYIEFIELDLDEAKGKHSFLFHGCFETVEDGYISRRL